MTQRSRIRILSSLPAETRLQDFAPAVVMPLVNTDRLVRSRRYLIVQRRERRFACLAPEALGPLIRASFVRTLRCRPQRNPVRFTSYAATTRMRRSRSNG